MRCRRIEQKWIAENDPSQTGSGIDIADEPGPDR